MDQFVEGKNPYAILGLEQGKQSTVDEIKKAYRRLALVKHPDKAKTANAAQEFDELKKAYAILTDKSARGALDDYLDAQAAREARLNKQDAKRQRMRSELERKEKEGAKAKNEEEQARSKLKVELEALRARAQQEQQEQQERHAKQQAEKAAAASRAADAAAATAAANAADDVSDDDTTQLLLRTVKVSWDPSVGTYTTERLREIFAAGWAVEDVILKDSRKKRKASALVVLTSSQDAQAAAQQVHGDLANPLLVTPYLKVVPGQHQPEQQLQQPMGNPADGSRLATAAGGQRPQEGFAAGGPKQPLFASGLAGATTRPTQKPSRPLFPGAAQQPQGTEVAGAEPPKFSSFPTTTTNGSAQQQAATGTQFSSLPSMPAGQPGPKPSCKFSSFPGAPSSSGAGNKFSSFPGAAGASSVPVGSVYEDAVLGKMQKKADASATKQQT